MLRASRAARGVLTHLGGAAEHATPVMVNVGAKAPTHRTAVAEAAVSLPAAAWAALHASSSGRAAILTTATLAGVGAAKRTSDAIPLCHHVALDGCDVTIVCEQSDERCSGGGAGAGGRLLVTGAVSTTGKTGVEMEALHAVTVAALTLYDMLKAASKAIVIERVRLVSKSGGKSGSVCFPPPER